MPGFSNFSGMNFDRPLSKDELVRAIRFMIAAELEAVEVYSQIRDAAEDEKIKKAIQSVIEEEKVHSTEFQGMVDYLVPEDKKFQEEGMKEVSENLKSANAERDYLGPLPQYHLHNKRYEIDTLADAKKHLSVEKYPYTHVNCGGEVTPPVINGRRYYYDEAGKGIETFQCKKCKNEFVIKDSVVKEMRGHNVTAHKVPISDRVRKLAEYVHVIGENGLKTLKWKSPYSGKIFTVGR